MSKEYYKKIRVVRAIVRPRLLVYCMDVQYSDPPMPQFPIGADGKYVLPRLTAQYLRSLYFREPTPIVRELLWEVHRLRLLVLRADQLQRGMGVCGPEISFILEVFRREIADEPCIEEHDQWTAAFFGNSKQGAYVGK